MTNQFIGNTQIDAVIAANILVPEPATLALAAFALVGLVAQGRRRRA